MKVEFRFLKRDKIKEEGTLLGFVFNVVMKKAQAMIAAKNQKVYEIDLDDFRIKKGAYTVEERLDEIDRRIWKATGEKF